jgi:DHA3 family tetracycline resistance protein-like MFS transporter
MAGMHNKLNAFNVYLVLSFTNSLLSSLIFTVNMIYQVTVVGLRPLQLVLVGTILELAVFVFEIPTGVLADVRSRRLSIIVGYVLIGLGFIVEGSLPFFATVALAQVVWGLGYTFTSGATQAWMADEVGQVQAGQAFIRGEQAAWAGDLLAIPFSVALGSLAIALPIVAGGALMVGLALFLAMAMPETGFRPTPPSERTTWHMMLKTVGDARQAVRRQPVLLALLGIGLFYGLYSEGFDRLWTAHLLQNFEAPWGQVLKPVAWFGAIRAALVASALLLTPVLPLYVLARRRSA